MTSGGFRPDAPQNNFGVSATGGNGKSGKQPIRVAPGGLYGQRTQLVQQQQGAPMAAAQPTAQPTPTLPKSTKPITPLFAPTERPQEPVTTGVPNSPGAGPEVLNLPNPVQTQYNTAYDVFQGLASQPGASPAVQYLAQRLKEAY